MPDGFWAGMVQTPPSLPENIRLGYTQVSDWQWGGAAAGKCVVFGMESLCMYMRAGQVWITG